ncbi:MAG: hypothetical protein LBU32_02615 [Clostridiales bacterium]|jgi:cytoskeletal protein RodZ|nr:hypothetical protein [Clostridiales bacterium]
MKKLKKNAPWIWILVGAASVLAAAVAFLVVKLKEKAAEKAESEDDDSGEEKKIVVVKPPEIKPVSQADDEKPEATNEASKDAVGSTEEESPVEDVAE